MLRASAGCDGGSDAARALGVVGDSIVGRVPLVALGHPSKLRIAVTTQRSDHASGDLTAEDQAPKGDQFTPGKAWLTLGG